MMQASATMTMTLVTLPVLAWWAFPELWTAGPARKFGPPHINYIDRPIVGSAGGPTEQAACFNVRQAAKRKRDTQERALIDFVIQRYYFYRETQADYSVFACKAAVARDAGVTLERVSDVLRETYAYAA